MPKSNNKTPEVPQWCKDAAEEICEGSNELASEIIFRYYEGNALPTPPAPAASEVERFTLKLAAYSGMGRMYLASKQVDDCEVVTAADHDRIIAERDAVIAELQRQVNTMQASCDMNINAASVAEELLEHERQTHKELGEIVGTDNSLAECCKRLRARAEAAEAKCAHWYDEFNRIAHQFRAAVDPDDAQKLNPEGTAKLAASFRARAEAAEAKCDAIRVQWQSLHDEREEQHAALRRRGIRFVKVGGVLEAIGADRELDMLKTPQSQADIDEAEEIAEGCVVNMENFDDVSSSEMHLVCTRLLNLREQQRRLQRHIRDKEAVIDELSGRCEKLAAEHAAALGLVADIRNALGDNGKRMQPELLVHCTQLAAANERVAALTKERDGLREVLKDLVDDICERVDMQSPSTNPGMKVAVKNAQAALASLSQQNGEGANQPVEWEKIKEANKWDNLM